VLLCFLALIVVHAGPADPAATLWQLEIQRAPASTVQPWLDHEDPVVRANVADTLGRLRSADAVPLLVPLVKDPVALVRIQAAFALGQSPASREVLLNRVDQETDTAVQAALVAALGHNVEPGDLALLLKRLEGPPAIRREAAVALGRLAMIDKEATDSPQVATALAAALKGFDVPARQAAAFALRRVQPTHLAPETQLLLADFQGNDRDSNVRALLTRALAPSSSESQSQSLLATASIDASPWVRAAAARALPDTQHPNPSAALAPLLTDPSPSVRLAATRVLVQGDSPDPELLAQALEDSEAAVVAAALPAWLASDPAISPRPWLEEGNPLLVRASAVSGLRDAAQLQRILGGSPEPALRTAAAERLLALPSGDDALTTLLSDPDPVVVAIGLSHWSEHPDLLDPAHLKDVLEGRDSAEVLLAAYDLMDREEMADVGLGAVAAGQLHPDLAVRNRARELAQLREAPPPPPGSLAAPLPDRAQLDRIRGARIFTEAGEIRITLLPEVAPSAVLQFTQLAESGFYDGNAFHRVVPGFVIQAGCPRGDGWGGPERMLPAEPSLETYTRGTLGMADAGLDTAGSQWFIALSPQPHLEGRYTVFGQVSVELGTLDKIHPGTRIEHIQIERLSGPALSQETKLTNPGHQKKQ
jgi:cyclophilin family peptidyl-prolyl cis-trans isomerase/HEAT repeat protein